VRFITLPSAGSEAKHGNPLIHLLQDCPQSKPKKEQGEMAQISPKFPVRMYFINFKILSNITRPSFTAIKIVEKIIIK
jgi:hypothetical protein